MVAVFRRFVSWRWCGGIAAFFALVAIFARSADPVFHTVVGSFAGALAGLAAVIFFQERMHPDEIWSPSPELSGLADRLTPLARGAAALVAVTTVVVAFIHPQWRDQAVLPTLILTFFAYVQERLRTTSKKEPIWTP